MRMASAPVKKSAILALAFSFLLTTAVIAEFVPAASAAASPAARQSGQAKASPSKTGKAFTFVKENNGSGLKEYRLNSNGMKILLQEKHSAPLVTVMVVYKVGSRNEAVGYTGSTHFLEHMMFKGTPKHDPLKGTGLDDLLKPIGGMNNATTSVDRTNYYEIVPAKDLALCLELEADRMRNALLRNDDRKSEMTVVRNELERGENSAEEVLNIQLFATAFREHPYHHPTIGWRSDVEGVPIERLRQFYRDFYYPNNATLLVMGDFQSDEALALVDRYFSKIPKSPKPFPEVYTQEPPQDGEKRFIVKRGDEMPKLMLGYKIPRAVDKDTYALEVLAAILGDQNKQSSRLYKKLVDSGLASETYAYNSSLRDPGLFSIYASATSGSKLETLEKAIKDELTELAAKPVLEAELDRSKKSVWKRMRLGADDPMNFAQQLAEAEAVADWSWWFSWEKNVKAVTASDIQRVAKKYFGQDSCSIGYHLPKNEKNDKNNKDKDEKEEKVENNEKGEAQQKPETSAKQIAFVEAGFASSVSKTGANDQDKSTNKGDQDKSTKGNQNKSVSKASVAEKTRKKVLKNGLTVYVMPSRGSGIVAVSAKLKGGESSSGSEKSLVPELLGQMLNKGSKNFGKEELADILETMGSSIDPYVSNFWTEFSAKVVTEDFDRFLSLLADSIVNPALKQEELDKLKKQKEAELKNAMVDTDELADNKLSGALYKKGCVYYARPFEEQIAELSKMSVEDLSALHKSNYVANNLVMAIVGDISYDEGFKLAEKHFGNWQAGKAVELSAGACKCQPGLEGKRLINRLPDKSSVSILMGFPADTCILSKDFPSCQIANSALGHDTIASRLAVVREKHGLTYGITSSFSEISQPMSPWEVELTVNPENTEKATKLVRQILDDYYKNGISPDELKLEKGRLTGDYLINRMRTPRQLADSLSRYGALGLGPDFMDRYPKMLQDVSLEEANASIKKYMNPKKLVTSYAGSVPENMKE